MKKELKGFICGCIVTTLVSGITFAAGQFKTIDVLENDITVMVDGNVLEKPNFLYNDTTYLPLRAVAEAVGKPVDYDEATNTAFIGEKPDMSEFVIDVGGKSITEDNLKYYIANTALKYGSKNAFSEEKMTSFNWDDDSISKAIKIDAVNAAVSDMLASIEGEKLGIVLTEDDYKIIDSQMDSLTATYGQDGALARVRTMGIGSLLGYKKLLTISYLTNKIKDEITENSEKYMPQDIEVLNATLPRDCATAKHILFLVDDESKDSEKQKAANSVSEKIKAGKSFDDLMKEYNEDSGEPECGYAFESGEMVKEFEDTAFSLNLNQTSAPVKTSYGYHIIKRIPGYYDLLAFWKASAKPSINQTLVDTVSINNIISDVFAAYDEIK